MMQKRTRLVLMVLTLILCVGMLVGCTNTVENPFQLNIGKVSETTEEETNPVTGVSIVDGSIVVTYADGTTDLVGSSVTNITNNDISITTQKGDENTAAVSRAITSTVGVQCGFVVRSYQQGFFGGGQWVTQEGYSAGSGVILSLDKAAGDAYIITNFHVVYNAASITETGVSDDISIYLWGATETIPATFVGGSANYDIAVLRINDSAQLRASAAEQVEVANSEKINVGQTALVVGNPKASGISATAGIISVDSEYIAMDAVDGSGSVDFRVIRIDAPVNSGNSGGGLYDSAGRLVGIVNAKMASEDIESIAYAIPSNVAVAIANNIIDYCEGTDCMNVRRVILGISITVLDSKMIYNTETGLVSMVQTVVAKEIDKDSLASAAGVQADDVIVAIKVGTRDALTITRQHQVIDEILNARVGDTIVLTVLRNDVETSVTITVTDNALVDY